MVGTQKQKKPQPTRPIRPAKAVHRGILPGQIDGYWFTSEAEIPEEIPSYAPNGALVLDGGENHAAVLIEFNGVWLPLSEAAEDIYAGPRAIKERGSAFFVAKKKGKGKKIERYRLSDLKHRSHAQLTKAFGEDVARAARIDRKSVVVSVEPG